MAFVVKIKFGNTLRRLIIEGQKDDSLGLTFTDLVGKVRDMFQISSDERLVLTYMDQDNDLVTMSDDHDLYDACIVQKLNPLRIHLSKADMKIQEAMETFQKSMSTTMFIEPHKNTVEEVGSVMGNPWRNETSNYQMQGPVNSYKHSMWPTSKLGPVDAFRERFRPTSHRRAEHDARNGWFLGRALEAQSEWNDQLLPVPVRKYHHRMTRPAGGNFGVGKLDARFVCDITIFDGTELVSGIKFTKIWRLRNIGTLPWPPATRLVYTGGDLLGTKESAYVELPEEGLCCDQETNIAVDFVAPEAPGRYVSHWRLRAPSGQKFGQRVWVLIKVVSTCVDGGISHTANEDGLHQGRAEQDQNGHSSHSEEFTAGEDGNADHPKALCG